MDWQVHLLDEEVLEAAVTVQKLQRRRANLKALHHKLQVSCYPNANAMPEFSHGRVAAHEKVQCQGPNQSTLAGQQAWWVLP